MNTIIQNIGNIVVSDRKLSLFSDIQTGLALSKWPPIGLKFCMVVSRSVIFKIRFVLEGSEILRYILILPTAQKREILGCDLFTHMELRLAVFVDLLSAPLYLSFYLQLESAVRHRQFVTLHSAERLHNLSPNSTMVLFTSHSQRERKICRI
jgi:hypothetical protein